MKKKITLVATSVLLVAALVIGGTLAYFTDTDAKTNTFTVGNVDITLAEQYEQNSKLVPGDNQTNAVAKVVKVTNNQGSEAAYVRVHIAIPADLVDQTIDSSKDILHVNFSRASIADGLWSWMHNYSTGAGWVGNGLDNNQTYNTTIDNIDYTVFVVTYRTALAGGATTAEPAIYQMYIDQHVQASKDEDDNVIYTRTDIGTSANMNLCNKVLVVAEGVQKEGFSDAYAALNAAFGVPSTAKNPFNNYGA